MECFSDVRKKSNARNGRGRIIKWALAQMYIGWSFKRSKCDDVKFNGRILNYLWVFANRALANKDVIDRSSLSLWGRAGTSTSIFLKYWKIRIQSKLTLIWVRFSTLKRSLTMWRTSIWRTSASLLSMFCYASNLWLSDILIKMLRCLAIALYRGCRALTLKDPK